jgi:hypothetical protein
MIGSPRMPFLGRLMSHFRTCVDGGVRVDKLARHMEPYDDEWLRQESKQDGEAWKYCHASQHSAIPEGQELGREQVASCELLRRPAEFSGLGNWMVQQRAQQRAPREHPSLLSAQKPLSGEMRPPFGTSLLDIIMRI